MVCFPFQYGYWLRPLPAAAAASFCSLLHLHPELALAAIAYSARMLQQPQPSRSIYLTIPGRKQVLIYYSMASH
jgi:hypothetical protein